jgi:rare lipoprotein A
MRPLALLFAAALACASPAYAETGLASWYGWHWHGRAMANGRPFHALGANAASRKYPLGTHLQVTNLVNGRHTEVVIMDRGPYIKPRILDVSLGTARILGFEREGVTRVQIAQVAAIVQPVVYTYRVIPPQHHETRRHERKRRYAKH